MEIWKFSAFGGEKFHHKNDEEVKVVKNYLVTATPPTTNGDLHVGHLSGPYLAGDVFTRFQKMLGHQVTFQSSGDDHQSYIVTTSNKLGTTPNQLVKEKTKGILSTLQAVNIEMDIFTNSLGNRDHIRFVQNLFLIMYEKGLFQEKKEPIYCCDHCDKLLFESHIKGKCPYCFENASGNLCEACGRINRPVDLYDPKCSTCDSTPRLTQYTGLFFPIDKYRSALKSFYSSRKSWRPHLKALCNWLTSHPIPDYPVTYPSDWGIQVPVPKFEDQTINVWFEMYPGHLRTAMNYAQDEQIDLKLTNSHTTFVQFLGYDNSFFNAVLHLTTALALDGEYLYPDHIITNEFYLLENEKFSTSRSHAIWGQDIVKEIQPDYLRYHLCRTNPEVMQTNFSYKELELTISYELEPIVSTIKNFISILQVDKYHKLILEKESIDLHAIGYYQSCKQGLESNCHIDNFSLQRASAALHNYLKSVVYYFERSVLPMRNIDQKTYKNRLTSIGYLFYGLVYFSAPIMPDFSKELSKIFGVDETELYWSDLEEFNHVLLDCDNTCLYVTSNEMI